jgi:hypothetical protein
MLITLSKMSPEFLFGMLELLDFQHATSVYIEINKQGNGIQKFEDGREVWMESRTIYKWKDEECKRLLSFDQWAYVNYITIKWETASMMVDEHFTAITLRGHTSLPDISGLPGERPRSITMKF